MRIRSSHAGLVLLVLGTQLAHADECRIVRREVFTPQKKQVLLAARASDAAGTRPVVIFQSKLRVNTDGAPNSYHPVDLTGREKAINHICNAISVRSMPANVRLPCARAVEVFAQFRDNGWVVPSGFRITWSNVLAATQQGTNKIPCVFQSGEHTGYFGSLTRLQNDLPAAARGECEAGNQLDERVVPALVMAGGANPVSAFGAGIGDLLVAFNPKNGLSSAAVIGDSGPEDNLGEGSVALNMALLGKTVQPTTYNEAKQLDTGNQEMLVAILPKSRTFKPRKPFTRDSIDARVQDWQRDAGFDSGAAFVQFAQQCLSAPR